MHTGFEFVGVRKIALVASVFGLLVACGGSEVESTEATDDTAALTSNSVSADAVATTCQLLGEVGSCHNVSICRSAVQAACRPKPAVASDAQWQHVCPLAGFNEQICGYQPFCQWEQAERCIPLQGAGVASGGSHDDRLRTACATLGAVNECQQVSICRAEVQEACRPKPSAASNPEWQRVCPIAGPTEQTCGWQPYCQWERATQCTPR